MNTHAQDWETGKTRVPPPEQPEASATPESNKERAAALWCRENWHAGFKIAGSDTGYAAFWAFCAGYECQLAAVRCELEGARAENAKLREALESIGIYKGEGGPGTPWRDIVRDCGAAARAALATLPAPAGDKDAAMTFSATGKAETP